MKAKAIRIIGRTKIRIAIIIIIFLTLMMTYDHSVASARSTERSLPKPLLTSCLELDRSQLNFGELKVRETRTQRLTIKNCGSIPLTLYSAQVSGANSTEFRTNNPADYVIRANQACYITTTFKPTRNFTGSRTSQLKIRSSARDVTVTMRGTVITRHDDDGLTNIPGPGGSSPPPCDPPHRLYFKNNCSKPVRVAVRYWVPGYNTWRSWGWWSFGPNEAASFLRITSMKAVVGSYHNTFYYYAETTDGSGWSWPGDHKTEVNGRTVYMKEKVLPLQSNRYNISISCN